MTDPGQQLAVRLRRRPSPFLAVLGRLAFTLVWNGFMAVFIFLVWPHRDDTPLFVKAILGFFVLLGLGMVWDIVVRAFRALVGKTAIVEIDRQPLRLGETAQVRLFQSDLGSLKSLEVLLVGENTTTETRGSTTITRSGRCHQQSLFSMSPGDAVGADLDRSFGLKLPTDVPPGPIAWKIVVAYELKQGGRDAHGFPLQVSS